MSAVFYERRAHAESDKVAIGAGERLPGCWVRPGRPTRVRVSRPPQHRPGAARARRQRLVGLGRDAQATSLGTGNVAIAVGNPGETRSTVPSNRPTWRMQTAPATSPSRSATAARGHAGQPQPALRAWQGSNAFSYGGVTDCPLGGISTIPSGHNTSVTIGDRSEAGAVGPASQTRLPPSATTSNCKTTA